MAIAPNHRWSLPRSSAVEIQTIIRETGVAPLVAFLLYQRGCRTPEAIKEFLNPSLARLNKPDTLPDIGKATERIIAALDRKEPMLVYGDYDVDGVCGTALLVSVLKSLGGRVYYYLPHRENEGYGLSVGGLEFAHFNNIRLIITNDCGSTDIEVIKRIRSEGIDVIVTDHHEPGPEFPAAVAFVNPKRMDSIYPFSELAGVGVTFKLAWSLLAVSGRQKEELIAFLDLVGLGTLADVVPLVGENRVIARFGLVALSQSNRPGIRALVESSGLRRRSLTARDVNFVLVPRLNAAGRVGHAHTALKLLLAESLEEATILAQELEELNRTRQKVEEVIFAEVSREVEERKLFDQRVVVLARAGWSEGVVGIVAARLVERFWRPCIVIAIKEEMGKGSGRSITNFNLYRALKATQGYLVAFGGHRYAAGVKIRREMIEPFTAAINQFASGLPDEIFEPTLHIEAVADLSEIDGEFLRGLAQFEPFGPDNPEPVFVSMGVEVVGYPRRVGKEHLKFKVRANNTVLPAIAWKRSSDLLNLQAGKPGHLDICYTVKTNSFQNKNSVQLNVLDLATRRDVSAGQKG